jgi:hypothetical protein
MHQQSTTPRRRSMVLSPPEQVIHPRYAVHYWKRDDGTLRKVAIRDDNRGTYVRTLPPATPERVIARVIRDLEERFRPASVIYLARRITNSPGREPWEPAVVHGDIVEMTPRYRVVMDQGRNLHTISAKRHIRTIWGSTVEYHYSGHRHANHGAITCDRVDVEGWTEPRHRELHRAVHGSTAEAWFADFVLRYGLGGRHWQWDEMVEAGRTCRPVMVNGQGQWLLRHWDREHPEIARELYGIED